MTWKMVRDVEGTLEGEATRVELSGDDEDAITTPEKAERFAKLCIAARMADRIFARGIEDGADVPPEE
jgi:hypothetical protein